MPRVVSQIRWSLTKNCLTRVILVPMEANAQMSNEPVESVVSTPAFLGQAHRLDADVTNNPAPADSSMTAPPTVSKAVPKTPPPSLLVQSPPQSATPIVPRRHAEGELLLEEGDWNQMQYRQLREPPKEVVPTTDPPTVMPSHMANLPELPVIPPDALAQDVDLKQFPVFGEWKKIIQAAPYALSRDAQLMERYNPIGSNIPGFNSPVDRMSELRPASGTHVFIPIPWNAECVTPPYANFYLDGHRVPPCNKGLTGYEFFALDYTGPMVFEEYWNRMIGLWKRRNEARREHAKMIAEMKGVPLEFGEFGDMPFYKRYSLHQPLFSAGWRVHAASPISQFKVNGAGKDPNGDGGDGGGDDSLRRGEAKDPLHGPENDPWLKDGRPNYSRFGTSGAFWNQWRPIQRGWEKG
eukprot:2920344-Amphidinium_carterae.1